MATVLPPLQPNATLTLDEGVSSLLAYLDPAILIAPGKGDVPIAVLTGIMTLLTPLVYLRLWKSDTLWFFRVRRIKGSGVFIVTHPLNVFSFWLCITGISVLTSVCVKLRFGATTSAPPLQAYTTAVLASWVILPLGAMNIILGTVSVLAGSDRSTMSISTQKPVGWVGKTGRVLCGKHTVNVATVAAPLIWVSCNLPFLVLAQVYLRRSLTGLESLQAAAAISDASTSAMTMAQLSTFVQAWDDMRHSFWYVGVLALVWAIFVSLEALVFSLVGLRVLTLLHHQLTMLKRLPRTTDSAADKTAGKIRYMYGSITILGSLYFVIAVSGLVQLIALALITRGLWDWKAGTSVQWFRLGNLIYQWVIAINGLGVMLLVSTRVHAAVTADAAPRRVTAANTRKATIAFAAERDNALKG